MLTWKSIYILFIVPVVLAIFATLGYGFSYKAGVTVSCIIILLVAYKNHFKEDADVWFILMAFFFSIIGDWFLSNKGDSFLMFSIGIGLYFLAHAGYLWYALKNGRPNWIFTIIVLIAYLTFFFVMLWPAIDDAILLGVTLVYLLISCFSLGASIDLNLSQTVKWSYFVGIALILFSDTIISFKEFTSYQDLNYLILPSYYIAHMAITFALIEKVR